MCIAAMLQSIRRLEYQYNLKTLLSRSLCIYNIFMFFMFFFYFNLSLFTFLGCGLISKENDETGAAVATSTTCSFFPLIQQTLFGLIVAQFLLEKGLYMSHQLPFVPQRLFFHFSYFAQGLKDSC